MSGYDFYKIYQPLHLHFTSTYDVLKYGGKSSSVSFDAFSKRKDKQLFEYWSTKFPTQEKVGYLCVANFSSNKERWLYNSQEEAEETLTEWFKKKQSLTQTFKNDYKVLLQAKTKINGSTSDLCSLFVKTPKGNRPPLLQLWISDAVCNESVIGLDSCYRFINDWKCSYEQDPLISDRIFTLKKYIPFCPKLKPETIKEICKENER